MSMLRRFGLAAGLSLALAGAASAQDITIGVAGPLTISTTSISMSVKPRSRPMSTPIFTRSRRGARIRAPCR